jgi:hypothetical protein
MHLHLDPHLAQILHQAASGTPDHRPFRGQQRGEGGTECQEGGGLGGAVQHLATGDSHIVRGSLFVVRCSSSLFVPWALRVVEPNYERRPRTTNQEQRTFSGLNFGSWQIFGKWRGSFKTGARYFPFGDPDDFPPSIEDRPSGARGARR